MKSWNKPVVMDGHGRLTLPAEIRRELGIEGEAQFVVEMDESGILLRPALTIPREDRWAYTAAHREELARALADVKAGRVRSWDGDLESPRQAG
jgi:AbrB family looped-hinge helix DNA binding protein